MKKDKSTNMENSLCKGQVHPESPAYHLAIPANGFVKKHDNEINNLMQKINPPNKQETTGINKLCH